METIGKDIKKIKKKYKNRLPDNYIIVKPAFWDVPLRPTWNIILNQKN